MTSDATIRSDDTLKRTVMEVIDAVNASDIDRAYSLADAAIRQGAQQPALFNARAIWFAERNRYREALADFECARSFTPRDPALLNSIGSCLFKLDRNRQAVAAFDLAIASAPEFIAAHCNRAATLEVLGDSDAAQQSLERVVALQPDHPDALSGLASILLRKGQRKDARAFAERAIVVDPTLPMANLTLATADMEEKNFAAAEQRLRACLDGDRFTGQDRLAAQGHLADSLDRQGRTEDAFRAYAAMNEELYRLHAPTYAVGRAIENVRGLTAYFEQSVPWKASPSPESSGPGAPAGHIFLLGFMRSGTTLLESILASAPQIVALDEHDALRDAAKIFLNSDKGVAQLSALEGPELTRWRDEYWRLVRAQGIDVSGKVLLDKLPFHSIKLPLIARLFPDAKVIFALRDPRDVVFSAFKNQFAVQTDSFEFLRLEDCARYYAAVMQLSELYWSKLPLNLRGHRYEDLMKEFDATVKAVCNFVGIEWDEAMREFSEGVRAINIRSVSAPQVRQGLYGGAVGQWRRYERELAPILPILQPWVQRFGYPAR
jgi:tetratricopeptide (TPR) repeat protein